MLIAASGRAFPIPRRDAGCTMPGAGTITVRVDSLGGSVTWSTRYQSARPYEIAWKASFPTRRTGYVTIQSYDPSKEVTLRVVAKTVDGGVTWTELPLVQDFAVREFGVAFPAEQVGWVEATTTGFETRDGGASWARVEMGKAVNKIRLLGGTGYAIGTDVYKLVAG